MRRIACLIAVLLVAVLPIYGQIVTDQVKPLFSAHIVAGGVWRTEVVLRNDTDHTVDAFLGLHKDDGEPWYNLRFTSTIVSLAPGQEVSVSVAKTKGMEKRETGWLLVKGVNSLTLGTPEVTGRVVWSCLLPNGDVASMESPIVPASHSFVFPSMTENSGLALMNPTDKTAKVFVQAVGGDGSVADAVIEVGPFEKISQLLWEVLPLGRFRGLIFVGTGGLIVASSSSFPETAEF